MKASASPAAIFLMSAAVLLVLPPTAKANDTQCTVALVGGTHDNVVVPKNATCVITGATIRGNVKALEDSELQIHSSVVLGNVEGDKADRVWVNASTVRENITIKDGQDWAVVCATTVQNGNIEVQKMVGRVEISSNGPNPCPPNTVEKGTIKVEDNIINLGTQTGSLFVQNNTVAQHVQVFKNIGPGNKFVTGNMVEGVIQCYENTLPFVGMPNVGRAPDQPPAGSNQCAGTSQ